MKKDKLFPSLSFLAAKAISDGQKNKKILVVENTNTDTLVTQSQYATDLHNTYELINQQIENLSIGIILHDQLGIMQFDRAVDRSKQILFLMFVLGGVNYFFKESGTYYPLALVSVLLIMVLAFTAPRLLFSLFQDRAFYKCTPELIAVVQAIDIDMKKAFVQFDVNIDKVQLGMLYNSLITATSKEKTLKVLCSIKQIYIEALTASRHFELEKLNPV